MTPISWAKTPNSVRLLLLGYLTGVLFLADAGLRRLSAQGEPGKGRIVGALALVLLVLVPLHLLPAAYTVVCTGGYVSGKPDCSLGYEIIFKYRDALGLMQWS